MKVIFDTNVVLDVILDRQPFSRVAAMLMARVERGQIGGLLCATTFTTVHYIVSKAVDKRLAGQAIGDLLAIFEVAPVTGEVIELATSVQMPDFEDAVLHEAGRLAGAEAVITRDPAGFGSGRLAHYSPAEFEASLQSM